MYLNVHCASSGSACVSMCTVLALDLCVSMCTVLALDLCVSMCTVLALDVYVLHDLAAYRYNGASRNIKAIIIAIHFQSFI